MVHRLALTLALVLVAVLGLPANAAPAGSGTTLPGFAHLVVDHAHDHVFVSAGAGSDTLTVVNYNGVVAKRITNMPGASGMALVGSTLYVARDRGAAIDVVNTATLTKTGTIRLPRSTTGALAYARGRLWTQSGSCGEWGDLMSVSPATGTTRIYSGGSYCPLFRTSPLHPNYLFVAGMGISPSSVSILDVSYPTPRWVKGITTSEVTSNVGDAAISPDGRYLYMAAGAPYHVAEYRISDGQATGMNYPTGPYPTAAAVTDAGAGFVAAGINDANNGLQIYRQGSTTPTAIHDVGTAVAQHGVAFAPDGGKVFAVDAPWGAAPSLRGYSAASGRFTSITLSASRSKVVSGEAVRLSGNLRADDSANRTVSLYAQPFGQRSRRVATATAGAGGDYAFSVVPKRSTAYFTHWSGDAEYLSSTSGAHTVRVELVTTLRTYGGYKMEGKYRYFHVGRRAPMVASTIPRQPGRSLLFRVQRRSDGAWRPFEKARLTIPADGTLEAAFVTDRRGRYRIRAEFSGFGFVGDVSPWRYLRMTR